MSPATARALRLTGLGLLGLLVALTQVSLIARLEWPGAGQPQLAALAVLAVALRGGPRAGGVAGFGVGLVLDLLPPADHPVGQWAFVLCLLGAVVGFLAADVAESTLLSIAVGGVAAALAPLLFTLVGQLLGDPRAGVLHALATLPSVALSTLLLAVVVLPLSRRRRPAPIPAEMPLARVPLGVR
ncbi:hypothetical protein GCM10009547_42750 [Sporichthya brevicatena]|uniref:Rod shape-determining protein MreD n=1 Tax=Sporichthya brevicatena TaxID=171442 RepID=A0ABN1H9Q0_9ACTN